MSPVFKTTFLIPLMSLLDRPFLDPSRLVGCCRYGFAALASHGPSSGLKFRGIGANRYPVAIAKFKGERPGPQTISAIIGRPGAQWPVQDAGCAWRANGMMPITHQLADWKPKADAHGAGFGHHVG